MKKLLIFIFCLIFINPAFAYKEKTTVKVGITSQNFASYEHNSAKFISQNQIKITDMSQTKEIEPIEGNKILEITLDNDEFNIYVEEKLITKLQGPIVLSSNSPIGLTELNRKGKPAYYLGMFEIKKSAKQKDKFYLINVVDMQNYLRGVVPNEMPVSFGLEALKAQAIAARNYVTNSKINPEFDVVDSTLSQVYYGLNSYNNISDRAINETKGIYALYNNSPITALYFSTSPGITDSWDDAFNQGIPTLNHNYLKARYDNPNQKPLKTEADVKEFYSKKEGGLDTNSLKFRWEVEFGKEELENVLKTTLLEQSKTGLVSPKINSKDEFFGLKEIKAVKRTQSGKIIELEITSESGNYRVKKELTIRRILKKNNSMLNSANFYIEPILGPESQKDDQNKDLAPLPTGIFNTIEEVFTKKEKNIVAFKLIGGGFGHGVGMSQFGAYNLAKQGKKYPEILKHYYTDITLATLPNTVYYNDYNISYKTEFYYDPNISKHAYLYVNNYKKVSEFPFKINEYDFTETKSIANNFSIKMDIAPYLKKGLNTVIFAPLSAQNKGKTIDFKVEL